MLKVMEQINDLRQRASYIEFQDYLSEEDIESLHEINKRIKELEGNLHGYVAKIIEFGDCYFTGDETLTCCDEPTYFESQEEIDELYKKSNLYGEYHLEVSWI